MTIQQVDPDRTPHGELYRRFKDRIKYPGYFESECFTYRLTEDDAIRKLCKCGHLVQRHHWHYEDSTYWVAPCTISRCTCHFWAREISWQEIQNAFKPSPYHEYSQYYEHEWNDQNDLNYRYGYHEDYYRSYHAPGDWWERLEGPANSGPGYQYRDRWYSRLVKADNSWESECDNCCHLLSFHIQSRQSFGRRIGIMIYRCAECDCLLNLGQYHAYVKRILPPPQPSSSLSRRSTI